MCRPSGHPIIGHDECDVSTTPSPLLERLDQGRVKFELRRSAAALARAPRGPRSRSGRDSRGPQAWHASGRLTQKTVPGLLSSTQIRPPWASTASLQNASPRPRPVRDAVGSSLST